MLSASSRRSISSAARLLQSKDASGKIPTSTPASKIGGNRAVANAKPSRNASDHPVAVTKDAPLLVKDYNLSKSNMDFVNQVMCCKTDTVLEAVGNFEMSRKLEEISKSLKKHFDLSKSTSILLRKSTLNLIEMLNSKDAYNQTIILDGPKGVGKSSTMFNVVYHFSLLNQKSEESEKTIIVYLPNLSSWTSGKYEYESSKDKSYIQPTLATRVLKDFVFLNLNTLSKIPSPDANFKSLANYAKMGIENVKMAHPTLMHILDFLVAERGLKVLLAADQLNALCRNTYYHDQDSNQLTAGRFELSKKILEILSSSESQNVIRLGAIDRSYSQIHSKSFEELLAKAPVVHADPLDLSVSNEASGKEMLEKISPFGVILPSSPITEETSVSLHNIKRFIIPVFDRKETKSMLEYYARAKIIESKVSDENVIMAWMLTQGNPSDLLRTATKA